MLLCLARNALVCAQGFTIVALPDTQSYVQSDELATGFLAQTEWILDHAEAENIRFVTQLGDIVSHGGEGKDDNRAEWQRADAAMSVLDAAVIPWGVAVGNHELDRVDVLGSGYTLFLEFFGPRTTGRFDGKPWFGGASENELNTFQLFSAGGRDYLFLHLELDIPDEAIAWAQGVLETHPERATIVSTHIYLGQNFPAPYLPGPGRNSREEMFARLVAPQRQIFLVLNGHDGAETHSVSVNDYGGEVVELLQDYAGRAHGGDGWMRLVRIDEEVGEIRVETFTPGVPRNPSPRFERDEDSEFAFTVDFAERFDTPLAKPLPPPTAVTVDDFHVDTQVDWQVSQSGGGEGVIDVTDGALELRPQPRRTLWAMRSESRMSPGTSFAIQMDAADSPLSPASFLVSSHARDPLGPGSFAFALRRRGSNLSVLRYDGGRGTSTPVTQVPEGPLILWIDRVSFVDFRFWYEVPGSNFRRFIASERLYGIVEVSRLFVGVEAWSSRGDPQRFDDLRQGSVFFEPCPQQGLESGDTRCLDLAASVAGNGKLRLTNGANNTVSAVLDDGLHFLRPGTAWGIDIEEPGNAFFMASTIAAQPNGASSFGFRLRRDATWRLATIDSAETELIDTAVEGAQGPPGTMWIDRATDTEFRFFFEVAGSGERTALGSVTHPDLRDVADLFVGVQFFDTSPTRFTFDNLRSGPIPKAGQAVDAIVVDDFSADTSSSWQLSQSFGSGGTLRINTQIASLTVRAADATEDPILYTFTAERKAQGGIDGTRLQQGPLSQPVAEFDVASGNWIFTVQVDDDRSCPDEAADARCTLELLVDATRPLFRRGDADTSGVLNIADAIFLLSTLFRPHGPTPCRDALDTDDSGALEITDAILVLQWLFQHRGVIPPPGPSTCGPDPTADGWENCIDESCL